MPQAILVWTGAVLAIGLLLLMALGPVLIEVDSWSSERKHNRQAAKAPTAATPGRRAPHPDK